MSSRAAVRVLVVGDAVLDRDLLGDVDRVCPDAPAPVLDVRERVERPGGAGLAAVLLAGRDGVAVTLATCLGADDAGDRVRRALTAHGVDLVGLARLDGTRSVTRLRSRGQSLARVDEDGAGLPATAAVDVGRLARALDACDAVLVADYGGGTVGHPGVRGALARSTSRRPTVWDPHPRGLPPVPGVTVATPNRAEALTFAARSRPDAPPAGAPLDVVAARLREAWRARAVAATDGAAGVFTALAGSPPVFTPTPSVSPGDTCGAGDRFAGAVTAALAAGAVITEAVATGVEDVATWLAAGGVSAVGRPAGPAGAGGLPPTVPPVGAARAEAVRAAGGTVVATGGCFDVVHAGHVASLRAARRLGDCLVVLLNSDAAVRRLKGPGRPVHPVTDRVTVLEALECVDDVVVFDEDTPAAALAALRPDVWAKGGDYAGATLPEAGLVTGWGGRVVLLPYLPGRSTTAILGRLP